MSWLTIVFYLLTHFSDIIDLVRKFLDIIHGMPTDQKEALKAQILAAKASGDHDAVKAIIEKTCSGVGCPADVVGQ